MSAVLSFESSTWLRTSILSKQHINNSNSEMQMKNIFIFSHSTKSVLVDWIRVVDSMRKCPIIIYWWKFDPNASIGKRECRRRRSENQISCHRKCCHVLFALQSGQLILAHHLILPQCKNQVRSTCSPGFVPERKPRPIYTVSGSCDVWVINNHARSVYFYRLLIEPTRNVVHTVVHSRACFNKNSQLLVYHFLCCVKN